MDLLWEAEYVDGEVLKQQDGNSMHNSSEIDRDRLKVFRLKRGGSVVFSAYFNPSDPRKKLIFRRRTKVSVSGNTLGTVYLAGWHENIKGVSVKSICYIYEDGRVEFDDDRNDLELFPFEAGD